MNTEQCRSPRISALIPFFVFVVFYVGLSLWANDFNKVPMTVAFLVASATAMFLEHKQKLANKIEIFAKGMGDTNIMIMCLIFILAGAFTETARQMGAVNSAVLIAQKLIPNHLMLVGLFLVSCVISLAIGTSCGTIVALAPIALQLGIKLGIEPGIVLGAVVGGAMFGDNLSVISDTTIAATRTQGVSMRDKFLMNIKPAIPAMLITVILYAFSGNKSAEIVSQSVAIKDIWNILPYVGVLFLALLGMNVMLLLFFGTILAVLIGILQGSFQFWQALIMLGEGTKGMADTLIVAILAGGLLKVIRHNGGIGYLILLIEKRIRSPRACELGIFVLVGIINLFTANNTVAIVIAGPIARAFSEKYNCIPQRIAGILDSASCIVQGMIPYGAQILLAIGAAKTMKLSVSSLSIISNMYYPIFLTVTLILMILLSKKNTTAVPESAQ